MPPESSVHAAVFVYQCAGLIKDEKQRERWTPVAIETSIHLSGLLLTSNLEPAWRTTESPGTCQDSLWFADPLADHLRDIGLCTLARRATDREVGRLRVMNHDRCG